MVAYDSGLIDEEEFRLLNDMNSLINDYPYWNYNKFNLEELDDSETWTEFRFLKNDLYTVKEALGIPDNFRTSNRLLVDGIEGLCIFLKRLAYPCLYYEFMTRFGRPVPQYCIIFHGIMDQIYERFKHLLTDFNVPFLSPKKLDEYADAIKRKGAALNNCFGFIDGTVRRICRPRRDQEVVYNGHKKIHALKFQSVALRNGLLGNMFGPLERKRHDCALLRISQLLPKLNQHAFGINGNALCLYGDPAYPLRIHLHSSYLNTTTAQQKAYNKSMSQVRVSVEWLFADITNWYAFIDFKKI